MYDYMLQACGLSFGAGDCDIHSWRCQTMGDIDSGVRDDGYQTFELLLALA